MTDIPCPVCTEPTRDGLLCKADTARLRAALRDLPWLMRELRVNLTRQNQGGMSNGGRGREQPLPYDGKSSDVADAVTNTVGTWIRLLDEQADPGRTMTEWCAWLVDHMPAIRGHVAVIELYDDLMRCVKRVKQAIDRPPDREYVQTCPICGHGIYAPPVAELATCDECRRVADKDEDGRLLVTLPQYDVQAAHETRVATLRTARLDPNDLRTAVEAIRGEPLSIKTVRSWINRGRLRPKAEAEGTLLYTVEDALALAAQIPTRPEPAPRRRVRRVSA